VQRHLASYYAGLAWEANGDKKKAIEAYRRCLSICPTHLWSLEHLDALDPSLLQKSERELLDLAKSRPSPIAMLTPSVQWLAIAANPSKMTEIYAKVQVEYLLLCVAEVRSPLKLQMWYGDKHGMAFIDRVESYDGAEYTMRIGELIRMTRPEWQPSNLTLSSRRRVIANGDVVVRFERNTVKAFVVDIQGLSKPKASTP